MINGDRKVVGGKKDAQNKVSVAVMVAGRRLYDCDGLGIFISALSVLIGKAESGGWGCLVEVFSSVFPSKFILFSAIKDRGGEQMASRAVLCASPGPPVMATEELLVLEKNVVTGEDG
ncbi:hypothetical protein KSS87_016266 [Heliosperma pusillum]|nr:hypothetical protein KSS87_016266 [Heliosperma pusillum]